MSQTAARTLDLLELIAGSSRPLKLMELAGATGIDKSTTARLLGFLEERTLIQRQPATKGYGVGPGLLSLSAAAMRTSDLPSLAGPHLQSLRDETGETASLHLRVGRRRVCVAGAESRHELCRVLSLGESLPLCVGPSGKVMLAFLPDSEIRPLITPAAGRNRDALLRELESIRARGAMAVIGDRTPGVGALSVPLFRAGTPVASISVAGPADRWDLDAMGRAEPRVRAVAERLSAALGSGLAG
ncbi:MAG TPA: IclR family transcriptional regulator [Solirubrobacteraceae bacterium]|nr:IclR family transcriptional regulator [Solirubrobacteraceae bacterium]